MACLHEKKEKSLCAALGVHRLEQAADVVQNLCRWWTTVWQSCLGKSNGLLYERYAFR